MEIYSILVDEFLQQKTALLAASLGGILPALLWLWFWLREDRKRPEPKRLIVLTFLLGAMAGLLSLPFQYFSGKYLTSLVVWVLVWSLIEEFVKLSAAYLGGLRTKAFDEPVDALIYLISAALGFSALENTLYLVTPLLEGNWLEGVVTGNFRFIGASLLHIVSSSTIGVFIAFSLGKGRLRKKIFLSTGLLLATLLHATFNLFIMKGNLAAIGAILGVWAAVIVLLLVFEKVKSLPYQKK